MNIKKSKEYPTSIFKYCNLNTSNHVDNLIKNQIWLSNPLNFNDPYDCSVTYDSEKIKNIIAGSKIKEFIDTLDKEDMSIDIRESILSSNNPTESLLNWLGEFVQGSTEAIDLFEQMIKGIDDIQTFILKDFNEKYRKKLKVSSFSEDNESLLMWGHYTNNHEGFCIEYDLSLIDENENLKKYLFPITYSNERFDITNFYIDNEINKMSKDKDKLLNSILYKSEDWKYEKEWRFVISESECPDKTVTVPKPKAIYLGSKIKEEHRVQFITLCEKNDIDIFQMKLDSKIYKVNSEQI